jgi:hypothetical protein
MIAAHKDIISVLENLSKTPTCKNKFFKTM